MRRRYRGHRIYVRENTYEGITQALQFAKILYRLKMPLHSSWYTRSNGVRNHKWLFKYVSTGRNNFYLTLSTKGQHYINKNKSIFNKQVKYQLRRWIRRYSGLADWFEMISYPIPLGKDNFFLIKFAEKFPGVLNKRSMRKKSSLVQDYVKEAYIDQILYRLKKGDNKVNFDKRYAKISGFPYKAIRRYIEKESNLRSQGDPWRNV